MLNRPAKHNAMGPVMMQELGQVCRDIQANASIRAVVLGAAGEQSFSAGADLGWMKDNFTHTRAYRIEQSNLLADTLAAIDTLDKITIARVNGQAYAGGVGLLAVCDIVISVRNARFALTETRLGLTPANISPYLLARLGPGNARRILLNSHVFTATEAVQLGLVHKVVAAEQLDEAIAQELSQCLACAPGAVAMTKQLLRRIGQQTPEQNKQYTANLLATAWETAEAQTGVRSFLNKEKPPWAE